MKKWVLAAACCLIANTALAESADFQLSLTPDVAIQPTTTHIDGLALNLWGENPQDALAVGFVNGSTGNSSGLSLGFLANYAENYKGVHLAWIGNYASGTFTGVQWAMLNYAGTLDGLQLGFVNIAETTDQGVQIGAFNIIKANKTWFGNLPTELAPGMVFVNWRF